MPFDGLETPFNYLAKIDQVIDLLGSPSRWIKHAYSTPQGRYCLKEALSVGGIADVLGPIILKAAEEITGKKFCCLESFNDWPQTSHGDILAVLHRARENIEAGKTRLPAPAPAVAPRTFTSQPTSGGWVSLVCRKLFC
jgi:hypothetical protein